MPSFNRRQLNTAIQVLAETRMVRKWAEGELRAYGIDVTTDEGKKVLEAKKLELAKTIIDTVK